MIRLCWEGTQKGRKSSWLFWAVLLLVFVWAEGLRSAVVEVDGQVQCLVPGCKTCFTADNCLLCDSSRNFLPVPI